MALRANGGASLAGGAPSGARATLRDLGLSSAAYEWRDASFGEVPSDAVRAGVDKSGEPLFVGRAFHEGDVVPAKVVPSHGGAYVPWGGKEHKKDYYEVRRVPVAISPSCIPVAFNFLFSCYVLFGDVRRCCVRRTTGWAGRTTLTATCPTTPCPSGRPRTASTCTSAGSSTTAPKPRGR
ncbi:hypothetical protein ONE63_003882 [Megalurothrips usitatus]|uniref:Uncharacterized protein n=1 Tax=Megalurothrips usitatus TaxID=439358 RepID=A0AAV7X7G1_9NEOP|nr:hypothetical protein ONE63_003882 [Megalurothrips usitatus]